MRNWRTILKNWSWHKARGDPKNLYSPPTLPGVTIRPVGGTMTPFDTRPLILLGFGGAALLGWAIYTFTGGGLMFLIAVAITIGGALIGLRLLRGSLVEARKAAESQLQAGTPITPSERARRALVPGEEVLWEGRRHLLYIWKWCAGGILLQPLTIYLIAQGAPAGVIMIIWFVAMAAVAIRIWMWEHDKLIVTDRRIIEVSGLLKYNLDVMPLAKLTDAKHSLPAFSRFMAWVRVLYLPYGTIVVESAGQDQALSTITFVPCAEQVYKIIMSKVAKVP
jgi:hypothetical protein